MRRWWTVGLVALAPVIARAQVAQQGTEQSPIADMITSAKNSLNDLKYDMARQRARELLTLTSRLKRSQEITALEVAAAAFFPEDSSARQPDSARVYLGRLARYLPEGPIPAELSWRGLDSLLDVVRTSTFGAMVRAPQKVTLRGTELRAALDVAANRLARWQLFVAPRGGGGAVLVDTTPLTKRGRLSVRAHNGHEAVIQGGSYEFRVLAISEDRTDTITTRFDVTAEGAAPTLLAMPAALDSSKFLPERAGKAIGDGVTAAILVGGATWAMAHYASQLPKSFSTLTADGRATTVAGLIGISAIVAGIFDPGSALPDNVKANVAMRADHLRQIGEAAEENRKRIAEYQVTLTFEGEAR